MPGNIEYMEDQRYNGLKTYIDSKILIKRVRKVLNLTRFFLGEREGLEFSNLFLEDKGSAWFL